LPKINPKNLSLYKAREQLSTINAKLIQNLQSTAVHENSINHITAHNIKLLRAKDAIKYALADKQKQVKRKRSSIEIKRLLDL